MSKKAAYAILLVALFLSIGFVSAFSFSEWFNHFFKITGQQLENATNTTNTTTTCSKIEGPDYYTKGSVTYSANSTTSLYVDTCNNDTVLIEYSCNIISAPYFGTLVTTYYNCPGVCQNGACNITSTTSTGTIGVSNNLLYATTPPPVPCTDSDGGFDYYVKGVGTGIYGGSSPGYNATFGQEPNPNTPIQTSNNYSTYYDHCSWDPSQVNEGFCDSKGLLQSFGYKCPYGCQNGVCIASPTNQTSNVTCTNTDTNVNENPAGISNLSDGWNPAIKGTLTLSFSNGTALSFTESCSSDGKVIEYYCSAATPTKYGSALVNCLSGTNCVSGVCVSTNPNLIFGYCKITSSNQSLSAQSGTLLTQSDCNLYCNQVRASNPSYSPTSLVCYFTPSGSATATIVSYDSTIIPTNTTSVPLITSTPGGGGGSSGGSSSGGGGGGSGGSTGFIFGKAQTSGPGSVAQGTPSGKEGIFGIDKGQSKITTPSGIEVKSQVVLQTDDKVGKAYAVTAGGEKKEIVISPENAQDKVREKVNIETLGSIVVKEDNGKVVYNVEAVKDVKLFGFIKAKMNLQANVDVTSGEVVNVQKPWWAAFTNFR